MKKILIADDHPDIRRLLSITLGGKYQIFEASDGVSALQALREHRPDALVLDIMMPGALDGLQVLDRVKADPDLKSTLVAMVTARGQAADYRAGQEHGADAYFIKPFSPLQVVNWLREKLK